MRIALRTCLVVISLSVAFSTLAQVTAGVADQGKEILNGGMVASLDKGQQDGVQDGDEFDLLGAAGITVGRARVLSAQSAVSFVALTDFIGSNAIVPSSRFRKRLPGVVTAELTLQSGHSDAVGSLAFTSDGSALLSADFSSLKVWSLGTGELLLTRQAPLFSGLISLAASPTGGPAITGDAFGAVRVWNSSTFQIDRTIPAQTRDGRSDQVTRVGFFPDGKTLFSTGRDNFINIWDLEHLQDNSPLRKLLVPRQGGAVDRDAAIAADGGSVAVSVNTLEMVGGKLQGVCRIQQLSVADGSLVRETPCGSGVKIDALALGPGGLKTATTLGRALLIWGSDTTQTPRRIALTEQKDPPVMVLQGEPMALTPDGKTVIVTDAGGLRLIATADGSSRLIPSPSNITALAISRDGSRIAAGRKDGSINEWELPSGLPIRTLPGAQADRQFVAWNPLGSGIAASVKGDRIQLWDLASGQFDRTVAVPKGVSDLSDIRFSPDGKSLSFSGFGGISVIKSATGKQFLFIPGDGGIGHKPAMAFSPRGRYLVYSLDGSAAVLWDIKAARQTAKFGTLDGIDSSELDFGDILAREAMVFRFSADEKMLWFAQGVGGAAAWSIAGGQAARLWSQKIPQGEGLDISPDGEYLAVTSGAGLKIYDLNQRKIIQTFQTLAPSVSVVRFANSKNLLVFADGPMAQVWDIDAGRLVRNFIHTDHVSDVRFSPDDRLILTTDRSDQLSIWALNHPGRLARMMTQGDRDWFSFDEDGFFDGTRSAFNLATFHTTDKPLNPYYPEQFFNLFYQPGLLSTVTKLQTTVRSYLSSNRDARSTLNLTDYLGSTLPVLKASAPSSSSDGLVQLSVLVTDTGSGVRDCKIFRNGQMVNVKDGPVSPPSFTALVELSKGKNVLTTYCFNAKGIRSQPSSTTVINRHTGTTPTAFIIAVGIDDYHNPKMRLQNAEADAKALLDALGSRLADRYKVVTVYLPSSVATRTTILSALGHLWPNAPGASAGSLLIPLRPAGPDDLVIFVFAGHGMQFGDHFYMLPTDQGYTGAPNALEDPMVLSVVKDAVATRSVSDADLARELAPIQAGRIMMIVDACNSGGLIGATRLGPFNSSSFSQLAYDKGVYVLAAAQNREAALEGVKDARGSTHGYLTSSLLQGLARAPIYEAEPGQLSAEEWFQYAMARVGELTAIGINGQQHPQDYTPGTDGAPLWILH